MIETSGSAAIEINADGQKVWDILTDLSRAGDLSPECYKAEWEGDSTGPVAGAKIHGYNRHGDQEWDTVSTVITAQPGVEWSFAVTPDGMPATIWRHLIEPSETGCTVTESFDAPMIKADHFQQINRHETMQKNIVASLENLKAIAES